MIYAHGLNRGGRSCSQPRRALDRPVLAALALDDKILAVSSPNLLECPSGDLSQPLGSAMSAARPGGAFHPWIGDSRLSRFSFQLGRLINGWPPRHTVRE